MAGSLGTISGQVRLDIRQAVASYAALRAQNARTVYALRGTGDAMVGSGQTMAVAGGAMVYAFGRVVMAAAEFERKMDYASAVSGTTGQKMQELSDYALKLGQDTIYSAGEIADGFIELAKAGVNAEDIIGGIGVAMTNLGAAGDIPLAQSGQIITSTIQQFDLAAQDAVKVTDLLAGAANASIADISDIGVSLKYVGGVANAAGLTFEDTSTAISLLAKAGIRGSTAGTSLRQMIVSLGGATGPARDALSELGIITEDGGNKFFDSEGKAKSLQRVFQILQDSTSDLTNKQRLMYLRTIFNNRALSAASILTREGAKGFKDMNKEMSKVTAADVAAQRLDNLSGDLEILRGNIETLMIEAGSPFQETLRGWVQAITKLVQAFADLDPETQKSIIQFVAISGAVLLVMGAINIVLGTIFKFVASMLKLGAGFKFLGKIIGTVVGALKGFDILGLLRTVFGLLARAAIFVATKLNVVGLVISVLVAGLILAYNKFEGFRNVVNAVGGALLTAAKKVGQFFKLLVTDPEKAWAMLKRGVDNTVNFFRNLPSKIGSALKTAGSAILVFVDMAVNYLKSLPGRAMGVLQNFVAMLGRIFTLENIGYAIGFMVGTVVRFFINMGVKLFAISLNIVSGIISFFVKLPGRIGYLIGFMVGRVVGFMLRMAVRMGVLAARAVTSVINFMKSLPGRVVAFVRNMAVRAGAAMVRFALNLPNLARRARDGVINFIKTLPTRVATFLTQLAVKARNKFTEFKNSAINLAKSAANGFKDAITGLPGTVANIVGRLISAFKDKISQAFDAAQSFAGGLWDGFKDGLGIHSPSYIEEAMWQIAGVVDKETKRLGKRTMEVQSLSKKMASTQFGVGGSAGALSAGAGYRELASMQSRNQKRARTLEDVSGNARMRDRSAAKRKGSDKMKLVSGWADIGGARVWVEGVAQEMIDEDRRYQGSRND